MKRRSAEKETTVWIGKEGVTNAVLSQIKRQLDANEMVKVKVHKTSMEKTEVSEIAKRTAEGTTSEVVDVRGRTFTIYKQKKAHKSCPS